MKFLYQLISVITLSILLFSCGVGSGSGNNNNTPQTLTVPLAYTLTGGLNMQINVANNPISVLVDTGSVGLRILKSSLSSMSGITATNTPESYAYANGVLLTGVAASAQVTIGGISTIINFMLVNNVTCLQNIPNCPSGSFQPNGMAGIMGVRLDVSNTSDGIWSPFGQLPGNLANGFIVTGYPSSPSVTLGLTTNNSIGFNYINLTSIAQSVSNFAPYNLWSVQLFGGVSFPQPDPNSNLNTQTESGLILYDTGTSAVTIYNLPANESGIFANNGSIQVYQTLTTGNNFNWGITTSTVPYVNLAVKSSQTSTLSVNTGNAPFTQLDVLYNIQSGLIGFRQHVAITQQSQTGQMIFSDSYNCLLLPVCSAGQAASLSCVSSSAYQRCLQLQGLTQSGIGLNDSNNLYISMFQKQKTISGILWPMWMTINAPTTLFAGFSMTYSPDPSAVNNQIGWPVNSLSLQQQAFASGSSSTCLPYTNNGIQSFSPWLSHCSTFTQWAESTVFNVQVPPTQPQQGLGYDWCGLANKNNAGLTAGNNGWSNVTTSSQSVAAPVAAQILANQGCAVVVNYFNTTGAGHIAVVLPSTWQVAAILQNSSNYPLNVLVSDSTSFQNLLNQVGPEEMQAGLFNFQHTVVFNGFFSELVTPQDYNTLVYFYNPASCPN